MKVYQAQVQQRNYGELEVKDICIHTDESFVEGKLIEYFRTIFDDWSFDKPGNYTLKNEDIYLEWSWINIWENGNLTEHNYYYES